MAFQGFRKLQRPMCLCFETPEVGIAGIFVLLEYENELEQVTSDISFNSVKVRSHGAAAAMVLFCHNRIVTIGLHCN